MKPKPSFKKRRPATIKALICTSMSPTSPFLEKTPPGMENALEASPTIRDTRINRSLSVRTSPPTRGKLESFARFRAPRSRLPRVARRERSRRIGSGIPSLRVCNSRAIRLLAIAQPMRPSLFPTTARRRGLVAPSSLLLAVESAEFARLAQESSKKISRRHRHPVFFAAYDPGSLCLARETPASGDSNACSRRTVRHSVEYLPAFALIRRTFEVWLTCKTSKPRKPKLEFKKILDHPGLPAELDHLVPLSTSASPAPPSSPRHRQSPHRLSRLLRHLERRRPRHPHPHPSQIRIRQTPITALENFDNRTWVPHPQLSEGAGLDVTSPIPTRHSRFLRSPRIIVLPSRVAPSSSISPNPLKKPVSLMSRHRPKFINSHSVTTKVIKVSPVPPSLSLFTTHLATNDIPICPCGPNSAFHLPSIRLGRIGHFPGDSGPWPHSSPFPTAIPFLRREAAMVRFTRFALFVLLSCLLATQALHAQRLDGTLRITVTDKTGATIEDAQRHRNQRRYQRPKNRHRIQRRHVRISGSHRRHLQRHRRKRRLPQSRRSKPSRSNRTKSPKPTRLSKSATSPPSSKSKPAPNSSRPNLPNSALRSPAKSSTISRSTRSAAT